jgi:hypothetical protein
MKRTIILSALIMGALSTNAQKLSVGAKIGIMDWLSISSRDHVKGVRQAQDGPYLSMNSQVFARYQTKGHFAFEVGLGHNRRELNGYTVMGCIFEPTPYVLLSEQATDNYLDLNLSAQYKINMPACMKDCPLVGKIRHYVGLVASPTLILSNMEREYAATDENGPQRLIKYEKEHRISASAGLSHTMAYSLTKKFNLVSTLEGRYMLPNNSYRGPNTRASFTVGASYNVN